MSQPNIPPDANILQLALGRWVSQSLSVAARLGVADLLAAGPLPAVDLAAQTGSHAGALYRILRALASLGVFTESAPGTFANTATSEALCSDAPNSMRQIVMMFNDPWQLNNWSHLGECVQTGTCAPDLAGVNLFDQIGNNPDALATFQGAMSDMSRGASGAVLASYDFTGIGTLADIAGGHGLLLTDILRANPALKGLLFERAEVIQGAKTGPYLKDMESRVTLASGDFFAAVPAGADAYMMKHILHDWSDELCLKILRNIRSVVPATGKLLLVEAVIPPGDASHPGKWIDIEMLVNPGGKERTAEEWAVLLASGGFRLNRIVPTPSLFSVVEGLPV
jgi:O-methyltransferase domain/Dimerisation domain